jgi:hypothetical protein
MTSNASASLVLHFNRVLLLFVFLEFDDGLVEERRDLIRVRYDSIDGRG